MPAPRKYPPELRERAQRLVAEFREQESGLSMNASVLRIGPRVGVNPDTLRGLVKRADIDSGKRSGVTTGDALRIKDLERENRELKRAHGILLAASSFLRAGVRPATAVVVGFIDGHRDRFGVAPICRVLSSMAARSPRSYYAFRSRPPSARSVADAALLVEIGRVHADRKLGRGLYGVRKVWHQLRREGIGVARCTVERLMRTAGLHGMAVVGGL